MAAAAEAAPFMDKYKNLPEVILAVVVCLFAALFAAAVNWKGPGKMVGKCIYLVATIVYS